jgi:hypothetical protein
MCDRLIGAAAFVLLSISFVLPVFGRTVRVSDYGPDFQEATLQAAVNDPTLTNGDIVLLSAGTYTISSGLIVTKPITLKGTSNLTTIVSCRTRKCILMDVDDPHPPGSVSTPVWRVTEIGFKGNGVSP